MPPSYEELAALVAEQAAQLAEQAVLIEALRAEVAALRRQVDRDSSNSSQPPSSAWIHRPNSGDHFTKGS